MSRFTFSVLVTVLALAPLAAAQEDEEKRDEGKKAPTAQEAIAQAKKALMEELSGQGIRIDLDEKVIRFDAKICMDRGPAEYLLVGPGGATHESLLISGIQPSSLNAAIKALGLKQGENVRYVKKDPPPSEEELKAGEPLYHIYPPEGDELEIFLTWNADAQEKRHRAEECILNAVTEGPMPKTGWVYIASRFVEVEPGAGEVFIADLERNIISIYQFEVRNSILVNPLRDGGYDDIWFANPKLLPEVGTDVIVELRAPRKKGDDEKQDEGDEVGGK
ncbi:MAG: YdjY domain-containing protein [Planctomycetota bacterium]